MKLSTLLTPVILLPLTLSACGDDDGGSGDGDSSSDGTSSEDGGTGDGGGSDTDDGGSSDGGGSGTDDTGTSGSGTDGTGTDGTGTDTGGSGTGGTTTDTTTSGAVCDSWVVTYDLTGSEMFIDSILDFTITVEEPYTDDDKTGPATMKIRFTDDGGAPGTGAVQIIEYNLVQNFVTGGMGAVVTTDLLSYSGPEPCGTAAGTFDGSTIAWDPAEMDPLCQDGTVSCSGGFCGAAGSPPENDPFVFDEDCSGTMDLNDFEFTNGIDSFTMDWVVLQSDANQTTTIRFEGTNTDESLDPATPACVCP